MKGPGLVDLQVNGYRGVDFSSHDLTEADFARACRQLLEVGTTAFLPTMVTSPVETYEHNLTVMARVLALEEFQGRLLGIHLEGPFISAQEGARGAHDAEYVRGPDVGLLERLIGWADNRIKLITIAADAKGADDLARYATDKGIAVSLGHQMATERDLERLVRAGAVSITHLGNGVPATLPRHQNPVWAGLANDDLSAMIIADGHHLPVSILKTIIRTKGPQRCVVVSDSAPLAGFKPGSYETMGHKVVLEEDGRLHDPVTGYFVGSSATILKCMNHLASLNLASPTELVAMCFYNPLKLIGLGPADVAPGSEIRFDEKRNCFGLLQ
jgi:N-acetylglucosamine-6-phosphate deacetylase